MSNFYKIWGIGGKDGFVNSLCEIDTVLVLR